MKIKKIPIYFSTIILIHIFYLNINAQSKIKYSFRDLYEIAINHWGIKLQENNMKVEVADRNSNLWSFIPTINLKNQGEIITGRQFDEESSSMVDKRLSRYSSEILMEYRLFGGFEKILNLKKSNYRIKAQEFQIESEKSTVLFILANMYLDYFTRKELCEVSKNNFEFQKELYSQIDELIENGLRPITDKYTLEIEVKSAEIQLKRKESEFDISKLQLFKLLKFSINTDSAIAPPDLEIKTDILFNSNIDSICLTSINNRLDINYQKNLLKTLNYDVKIAKSNYLPNLDVFYNFGSRYASSYVDNNNYPIPMQDQFFKENILNTVGVRLAIPLLNQYEKKNRLIKAKVEFENLALRIQNLEEELPISSKDAYYTFLNAYYSNQLSEVTYLAIEKTFDAQKEKFESGEIDIIEYSRTYQRYNEAHSEKIQAQYRLLLERINFYYVLGTLNVDLILQ